ncbi:hypothetical protein DdX_06189 [Ditylenchus destructor]|uniref:Secreted protein n=1 Tax=Ditylenchus destructor TaxID=166010 RepID=A0AAD4R9K0_9BILA|nr:hypothetical protein DdX_06189 [Ditylenchus destructor]
MPTSTSVVLAAASLFAILAEFSSNGGVHASTFDGIGGHFGFGDTRNYFWPRPQHNSMVYQQVPQPYYTSQYMDQGAVLSQPQPASENAPQIETQPKSASKSVPEKVPAFYMADEYASNAPFGSYKRANLLKLANQAARGFGRK